MYEQCVVKGKIIWLLYLGEEVIGIIVAAP
jgi:hypothetical protein